MDRHKSSAADWQPSVEQRTACAEAAAAFGLGPWAIASRRRRTDMIHARYAAVWLLKARWPELSWPKVARLIGGRDHSTAMHAYSRAGDLRREDPTFQERTEALLRGDIRVLAAPPLPIDGDRGERVARQRDRNAESWRPGMLILGSRRLLRAIRREHPEKFMEAA